MCHFPNWFTNDTHMVMVDQVSNNTNMVVDNKVPYGAHVVDPVANSPHLVDKLSNDSQCSKSFTHRPKPFTHRADYDVPPQHSSTTPRLCR